jgi:hypothetical protein
MNPSKTEQLESIVRPTGDHAYDGIITAINEDYVQVRLAGSPRKIIPNVIVADHIRKEVLRIGMFCKIGERHDREGKNTRTILTDILPQINYNDYAGKGTGIPKPPIISVSVNCDTQEWLITWSASPGATYYELYWSTDDEGSGATLITETLQREYDVPFDDDNPPKIYFAVRAISGVNNGELSAWVTDLQYLGSIPLITFGDDENHGTVTEAGRRYRCFDGLVEMSTNFGGSWEDVTPESVADTWSDTPAPTIADVSLAEEDRAYLVGRWENATNERRGSLWESDDNGDTWTEVPILEAAQDEIWPLWAEYNGAYFLLTVWQDIATVETLDLHVWTLDPLTYDSGHSLGAASAAEVDAKTKYAFPVLDPELIGVDDDTWWVAGNFAEVPA